MSSGGLNWLWAACRRARDTEWADFCDSGGARVVARADAILDVMWMAALDRRNAAGYATPRYDSMVVLSKTLDRARVDAGRAHDACHGRGKYAADGGADGAFHVHAKLAFLPACPAITGAARFWPKDFHGIAAEALATTAQRKVP